MKIQVLTAAVLAALASPVVFAASEGGDTWSEIQSAQQSTYTVVQSTSPVDPAATPLDAAFKGSEGGDTWSAVQALAETDGQQVAKDLPGRHNSGYAGVSGGSEGGDTWSRFVPQFQSQPVGSTGLASESTNYNRRR
jgi:hypothetical protein